MYHILPFASKIAIFVVTAKLICVFVFAYAKSRFSHDGVRIITDPQVHFHNNCSVSDTYLKFSVRTWSWNCYDMTLTFTPLRGLKMSQWGSVYGHFRGKYEFTTPNVKANLIKLLCKLSSLYLLS